MTDVEKALYVSRPLLQHCRDVLASHDREVNDPAVVIVVLAMLISSDATSRSGPFPSGSISTRWSHRFSADFYGPFSLRRVTAAERKRGLPRRAMRPSATKAIAASFAGDSARTRYREIRGKIVYATPPRPILLPAALRT